MSADETELASKRVSTAEESDEELLDWYKHIATDERSPASYL